MTRISPEVQALSDRLTAMDLTRPLNDKAAIGRAVAAHLEALGLPTRPLVWARGAQDGYKLARARARGIVWEAIRRADWGVYRDAAWRRGGEAAREAALHAAIIGARLVAREAGREDAWEAGRNAFNMSSWFATRNNFLYGIFDAVVVAAGNADRGHPVWDAAWRRVSNREAEWRGGAREAWQAAAEINGQVAFDHPTTRKLVSIWLPIIDAFEAGLFEYWITPHDVVCIPQPTLSIVNRQLHRADGPAVWWPSGEEYFFWRGVRLPSWMIQEPHKITVKSIMKEQNRNICRCMAEICGLSRYIQDSGARLVHEDECGRLWEAQVGVETWRIVEVEDGTPGPDGSRRAYTLDVTMAAYTLGWPIRTARAAVAATYGLRPEEYRPDVRT